MEDTLKKSTVGLVMLEDFMQKRMELEEVKLREAARTAELKCVYFDIELATRFGLRTKGGLTQGGETRQEAQEVR